jgi:hypothetical protein
MAFPERTLLAVVVVIMVGVAATTSTAFAAQPCSESPQIPVLVAALKPSDVLLSVGNPLAGETLAQAGGALTVDVHYRGPRLVHTAVARAVDDYHLAYFLDEDPSPYIGTLLPIPRCNPHIVHSASLHVTFSDVWYGSHSLAVVMAGSNNVSVNPPVALRLTFTVR